MGRPLWRTRPKCLETDGLPRLPAGSIADPTWVEPLKAGAELRLKRHLFPAHPTRPSRKAPTPPEAAAAVFLWEDRSRSGFHMLSVRTLTPGSGLYDVRITNRLSRYQA